MRAWIAGLMALAIAGCATPTEVVNEGPSTRYVSQRDVAATTACVMRAASEMRASLTPQEREAATPGGREVYVNSGYGAMMVAVITPAASGSSVTLHYHSEAMRGVWGDAMVKDCVEPAP